MYRVSLGRETRVTIGVHRVPGRQKPASEEGGSGLSVKAGFD